MKARFLALIVVYGTNPVHTASLQSLLANVFERNRLRILVWDNSPCPQANCNELKQAGLLYRATPENLSLSCIYNHVIAEDLLDCEHLILLDQDTVIPERFLQTAETAIEEHPDVDLFLPMVKANGNWVSPIDYYLGWGRYWSAPRVGRMNSARVSAINSGMVISARYLKGRHVYDEVLRFYGTDTQFMLDYANIRNELVVLDVRFAHDLSFFNDTLEQRARKFSVMRAAVRHIYGRRPFVERIGVVFVMAAVSLFYAWRYRSFSFLR